MDGVSGDEVPASLKHPLSLQADYASPTIYGWAGILTGVALFVLAAILLFALFTAALVFFAIGAFFVAVGYLILTRGR